MTTSPPIPQPDERSRPFWDAVAAGTLLVQQCPQCAHLAYPPDVVCGRCLGPTEDCLWTEVSGKAVLKTWTVVHASPLPGFTGDVPYLVGEVDLVEQEGLRISAQLRGIGLADVAVGMALQVDFVQLARDGVYLPVFGPAPS